MLPTLRLLVLLLLLNLLEATESKRNFWAYYLQLTQTLFFGVKKM